MKLCVISSFDLDQLEKWATTMFGDIPNNNREELKYPSNLYDESSLPRLIKINL